VTLRGRKICTHQYQTNHLQANPLLLLHLLSGFSTAGSKFISIVGRARMVSAEDHGIYTGSGLRGVIPYVQCGVVVFLS
jgi:hypothetical protein